jgi:4-hydroxythreonine-4-phosphate dehydrogenase
MNPQPIWISEGDPTGISYEILDKSYKKLEQISAKRAVILVSSQKRVQPRFFEKIKISSNLPKNGLFYIYSKYTPNLGTLSISPGKPGIESGLCSYYSLKYACKMIQRWGGHLITLPLSKEWILKSGKSKFSGHTEYLANYFQTNTYMIMYSEEWKVFLLTTHVPLKKVIKHIKKIEWNKLFSAIQNSKLFLSPKIGFCGINPHAGEDGKIGIEEKSILSPVIKQFSKESFLLQGPFSADSIFTEEWKGKFDLIIACYHDQGLTPFKALVGKKGINLTIGLPFIRVSPDHGPAYDIAGKNLADPTSLEKCLDFIDSLSYSESPE